MRKTYFALVVFSYLLFSATAWCSPSRNPDFNVPERMRPRVEFWIDVFARYGKNQVIIHHRDFPSAKFHVLDFSAEALVLSDGMLKKYREKSVKQAKKEIEAAFKKLASGKPPSSKLEETIEQEMSGIPGGYRKVLKDGLIRSQTGIRERYSEAVKRSGLYLTEIEKIFVLDYGLPIELTRLPFVESSFNYNAYSSVGAAGIWQFMPATGRLYMTVNKVVDERRDPIKATHGAAQYLKAAYKRLGTWPLALTSYNHGVAGVARKVKAMGTKDLTTIVEHPTKRVLGFASNNFYPEFLAALEIYENLDKYFPNVAQERPIRLVRFKLPHPASVSYVTKELGVSSDLLRSVNQSLSSRVWSGSYRIPKGYELNVPDKYAARLENLTKLESIAKTVAASTSSVYGGITYRVRRGDSLSRVAKKYNTSVSKLKNLNGLKSDYLRVGQMLVVRERADAKSSSERKATGTVSYRVRSGDSLSTIAGKHQTSISTLKKLNGLRSNLIKVGTILKVPVYGSSSAVAASSSSKKAGSPRMTVSYVVRPGDTLSGIASKFATTVKRLKSDNSLRSDKVRVGQALRIIRGAATPHSYKVRSGDSLWTIGQHFGVSIQSIKKANRLSGSKVKIGQKLIIPAK